MYGRAKGKYLIKTGRLYMMENFRTIRNTVRELCIFLTEIDLLPHFKMVSRMVKQLTITVQEVGVI